MEVEVRVSCAKMLFYPTLQSLWTLPIIAHCLNKRRIISKTQATRKSCASAFIRWRSNGFSSLTGHQEFIKFQLRCLPTFAKSINGTRLWRMMGNFAVKLTLIYSAGDYISACRIFIALLTCEHILQCYAAWINACMMRRTRKYQLQLLRRMTAFNQSVRKMTRGLWGGYEV